MIIELFLHINRDKIFAWSTRTSTGFPLPSFTYKFIKFFRYFISLGIKFQITVPQYRSEIEPLQMVLTCGMTKSDCERKYLRKQPLRTV